MKVDGVPYRTIWLADDGWAVEIIDQTKLPHAFVTARLETAEDAVTQSRQMPPDLILMDVVLPGASGFQATRTLRRDEATSSIPIFICSSRTQESDKVWGLRQGARDYISKPVDQQELLSKIAALG